MQCQSGTSGRLLRYVLPFTLVASSLLLGQPGPQSSPPAAPNHDANFEEERKQANELFLAQKPLEALPLYDDLCRQDSTIAVFAERRGAGLLAKSATISDPAARTKVFNEAMNELKRAQSLGDKSPYVLNLLSMQSKTFLGAVLSGIPLTVGYTYPGKPQAQAAFRDAEAAFGHSDWAGAAMLYTQAAALDSNWYDPALFAGDCYFRLKDVANGGIWFARAVAIDPDRETGYRYWGDLLLQSGDLDGARKKYVDAVVAEPYGMPSNSALERWAKHTGHQVVKPAITRPEFTTPEGVLRTDPELAASVKDGRSSWIVYQQYRVAHGARVLNQIIVPGSSDKSAVVTPSQYRHTIAEEHAALRAMLADIETKLKDGALVEANLDPSIRNLRALERASVLGAWIAVNAADSGIHSDYPEYRSHHREHLVEYVDGFLIK